MLPLDSAWNLVRSGAPIDAETLFRAVTTPQVLLDTDPRTQILARDSLEGLRDFWGQPAFQQRVRTLVMRDRVAAVLDAHREEPGFVTLRDRLMNATDPDTLLQMLRELGTQLSDPASVTIGGSLALMLDALIVRHTDDVDLVNEIPEPLRREHALLAQLATRYGLTLTHFQSHYLPEGWELRTRSLGVYGKLTVRMIDSLDILAGKLFSRRTKDLDDVRHALPRLDATSLRDRIRSSTTHFRRDASLLAAATQNWYIVTGESQLP